MTMDVILYATSKQIGNVMIQVHQFVMKFALSLPDLRTQDVSLSVATAK